LTFGQLRFLCDENVHPDVIAYLRRAGHDTVSVMETGLRGATDDAVLQASVDSQRAVISHDADFGFLTIAEGKPIYAVVYLRPGHILADFTIRTIDVLARSGLDLVPPFLLVAHRRLGTVRIRLRKLQSTT
jgi:predicted nuclease of predicted toxin-antitoxin system